MEQIADIFEGHGHIMTGRAKRSSDVKGLDEKTSVVEEQVKNIKALKLKFPSNLAILM